MVGAFGKLPRAYGAIGDDVALIPVGGQMLVLKVDMLVEGTDVPVGMDYRQAARKAVAMCVSDFASKGVRPDSFMVSLGLKRGTTQGEIDRLGEGLKDAAKKWGLRFVGGDTNEAAELVIDCAMAGFTNRMVERKGAKPGEVLVVTGPFGYPPAGLKIMAEGAKAKGRFRDRAIRSLVEPTPNLGVGLELGRYLTSAMDSSDGLARSIHTLAKASGVGFEMTNLPEAEGLAEFAKSNGYSIQELILNGGEEYLIVGTVNRKKLEAARRAARQKGGELIAVGVVNSKKGSVTLRKGRRSVPVRDIGWTHLG